MCGVLLAILALILFIFEDWADGVSAVVGAISLFTSGGGIDWDQLSCNVFWLRKGLLDAENALVDALVRAALAYPAPGKLGTTDADSVTHPAVDMSPNGGVPLTRSRVTGSVAGANFVRYPRQLDASVGGHADLNFGAFPVSEIELPATMDFPIPFVYADTVIDGSGLQNGGMLPDGPFPSRNEFFGDALANAQQVLADHGDNLPRYNLDADRGYGWKTWKPAVNTFPGSGQVINPDQE